MNDFGTFTKVFKENHYYLSLLGFGSPNAPDAIGAVKEAVSMSPDVEKELINFLADLNWRPHLVAAVATFFVNPSAQLLSNCWETFDRGSWVSPQIAAVLSRRDLDFRVQAIKRLRIGCRLIDSQTYASPFYKPVQADPVGDSARAGKSASALAGLLGTNADSEVNAIINTPEVQLVIKSDIDGGGGIACRWIQKLEMLSPL